MGTHKRNLECWACLDVGEAVLHRVNLLHHSVRGLQQRLQHLRPRRAPLIPPATNSRTTRMQMDNRMSYHNPFLLSQTQSREMALDSGDLSPIALLARYDTSLPLVLCQSTSPMQVDEYFIGNRLRHF